MSFIVKGYYTWHRLTIKNSAPVCPCCIKSFAHMGMKAGMGGKFQFSASIPSLQCRVTNLEDSRVATLSRLETHAERRHAIHGTPADCVRLALFALDVKPDLVLSGINAGGTLGQDIVISGTVAAAREAAYHGVRSFWNINLPHLPPQEQALPPRIPCPPARSPLNVS